MRAMPLVSAVVYLLAAVARRSRPGRSRRRSRTSASATPPRRCCSAVRPGEVGPVPRDRRHAGRVERHRLRRGAPGRRTSGRRRPHLHRRSARHPLGARHRRLRDDELRPHLPGHRPADVDSRPRAAARARGVAGAVAARRARVRALLPLDRRRRRPGILDTMAARHAGSQVADELRGMARPRGDVALASTELPRPERNGRRGAPDHRQLTADGCATRGSSAAYERCPRRSCGRLCRRRALSSPSVSRATHLPARRDAAGIVGLADARAVAVGAAAIAAEQQLVLMPLSGSRR